MFLFGSRARGNHRPDSDIDIGILAGPGDCSTLYMWEVEQTQGSCGEEHVTVLSRAGLAGNDTLAANIAAGVLVFETQPTRP